LIAGFHRLVAAAATLMVDVPGGAL
jgi:hypothetical protein